MTDENKLIAPCGMNCSICLGYLREKNVCVGCRNVDAQKSKSRVRCIIRNCEIIKSNESGFCYECSRYPCRRLKQLDKRYKTKYGMSMIDNLEFIKAKGLQSFLKSEKERWHCRKCGGTICVHRNICMDCGE